ncbi:fibrinogen-like protein A [Lytechinus variegatus]|uniref:fibrinogen-like protein A n=1 Tax=Lytechinus variegatus TaxID=7654 RepID=UPI001BB26A1F|nr:fibrinogen-like protein A [Lytechinus variegatus]
MIGACTWTSDCDKNVCEGNCCEETIDSYRCHCSTSGNKPEPNMTKLLPSNQGSSIPRDCSEIQTGGQSNISMLSGVYLISPEGEDGEPFYVYCDMATDGGLWTVFQRRHDGSVDFYLYWSDYKHGFGNVSSEHWLGNDNIHRLSRQKIYELRIDLEDFEGHKWHATYNNFSIGDEMENYRLLTLGSYSGNIYDSMTYHIGYEFSTPGPGPRHEPARMGKLRHSLQSRMVVRRMLRCQPKRRVRSKKLGWYLVARSGIQSRDTQEYRDESSSGMSIEVPMASFGKKNLL